MSFIIRSSSYLHLRSKSIKLKGTQSKLDSIENHNFFYDHSVCTSLTSDWTSYNKSFGRLAQIGGTEGLALALRTDLRDGLYYDEVQPENYSRRKELYGSNIFEKKPPRAFLLHILDELRDPFMLLLAITGTVYTILGIVHNPEDNSYVEGIAILAAVMLVVLTSGINNYKMERRFREQSATESITDVTIIRAGKELVLPSTELMVGDIVALSTGSAVPCDGVLISGTDDLQCDESALTGETKAVDKSRKKPFVLAGSQVTGGEGLMLTTSVGKYTCWGGLLSGLQTSRERTPLQEKLDSMVKIIGIIGSVVASMTFLVKLTYWIIINKADKTYLENIEKIFFAFLTSVSLIIVAIPEGLPLAVTITLSYAMKKMLKDNNFVRVLSACETMGNATTICSDKTGTLTQNKMTVIEAWPDVFEKTEKNSDDRSDIETRPGKVYTESLFEGVALNSKVFILDSKKRENSEEPEYGGGNKTECAIFSWAVKLGLKVEEVRSVYPVEKAYPFNSAMKYSSVLIKRDGVFRMYLKGAAEKILGEFCSSILHPNGEKSDLSPETINSIEQVIDKKVSRGLRCICLAYKDYSHIDYKPGFDRVLIDPPIENFTFLAVVALKDPLRPDVRDSVYRCKQSGIIVRMVTGDHPKTAKFIANECGILPVVRDDLVVLTGEEFRTMNKDQMNEKLPKLRVMARSTPQDKEKLVRWYMDKGHTVAVTGDGANDALALKTANVGLAMGIQGTDVAKEASDVVILDDSFNSIVQTVRWGRCVFDNIRKFVQFQLTINIVALALSFVGAVLNKNDSSDFPINFTPLQLLWMNIIMDSGAAIAYSTEHPTDELLKRLPYRKDSHLISPTMWKNICGQASIQIIILLIFIFPLDNPIGYIIFYVKLDKQKALVLKTCIFNTFVWMQIFNSINSRRVNDEHNVFDQIHTNLVYPLVLLAFVAGQVIFVTCFGSVASVTSISFEQWMICVSIGMISLPVGFLLRLISVMPNYGFIEKTEDMV